LFFKKLDGINEEDDNDDDYEDCDSDEDDDGDESDDKQNYYKGLYKYEHDNEDDKFETKSHFTNYSMTSSVIRRNEKLKFVDEAFEELIKKQYAEDQMGALDTECEDITGYRDTNNIVIQHALEDFQKKTKKILYEVEHNENKLEKVDEDDEADDDESSDEEEEYEYIYVKEKQEDPIDCESVLSLTSNNCIKTNVIKEENLKIRLSKKTGVPMNVLKEKPISKNLMEKIDYKITRVLPEIPERKKDESKEEKKARKQAIKDQKRVRRQEKKINKLAFKEEKMKQTNQMGNLNQRVIPIKL
jgi:protein LTV1